MASLSSLSISQILKEKNIPFLNTTSFQRLFNISNHNTAYKTLQRLTQQKILKRIAPGKYMVIELQPHKFAIANFIYSPSYISLESALNYYGILPQFPFTITSVTVNRKKTIENQTTYDYSHISPQLYWGFETHQSFIIANKEKALIDLMYLSSKGLTNISIDELDLSLINKKKIKFYSQQLKAPQFQNFIKKAKLC
jgi:predicted transcriptional regulator of viral defense system